MRRFLLGLLLVGCTSAPQQPVATASPDPEWAAFARLATQLPDFAREPASPREQFLEDYVPTNLDVRRFLWSGEPLSWSHGRPLTPAARDLIWKSLDRYPEYTREYFAVFPDEYLDRAERDADFRARYETDWRDVGRTPRLVLEDLQGDAKFLRGRLHGPALQKYLAGMRVQQLKVVVGRAFLRLSPEERKWCIQALSKPKEFPGTSSCGTEDAMMAPSRDRLAIRYAGWAPRCLQFLSHPGDDLLARQLVGEYRRLALQPAELSGYLEIDPNLLARTLTAVAWSGREAFEATLREVPDPGLLLLRFDPQRAPQDLARLERRLQGALPARTRRVYLDFLQELAMELSFEPALAVLLRHDDKFVYLLNLKNPSPELLAQCKVCLQQSSYRCNLHLALWILEKAGDVSALPQIRVLEQSPRGRSLNLDFSVVRRNLGDGDPRQEAHRLYASKSWEGNVLDLGARAQLLNPMFEELCRLWSEKPKEEVTYRLLRSPCVATDRWLLRQLTRHPTPEILGEAARRRSSLRRHRDLLQLLQGRSGSLRGMHSLICGYLPDLSAVLSGSDENAGLALLAGAKFARVPLPLDPLPQLATRNAVLRRAVLSYLVSVDGPEVRRMLRVDFGEGNLPGLLGSQSFQECSARALTDLKGWDRHEEVVGLVTAESILFLHRDLKGKCILRRGDGPDQACAQGPFENIQDALRNNASLLLTRQDGPGKQEVLLLWRDRGQFRQAYFSDPEAATPQGQLILHLMGLFRECQKGLVPRATGTAWPTWVTTVKRLGNGLSSNWPLGLVRHLIPQDRSRVPWVSLESRIM